MQIDLKVQIAIEHVVKVKLSSFVGAGRFQSRAIVQEMTPSGRREFSAVAWKQLTADLPAVSIAGDLDVNVELIVTQNELPHVPRAGPSDSGRDHARQDRAEVRRYLLFDRRKDAQCAFEIPF